MWEELGPALCRIGLICGSRHCPAQFRHQTISGAPGEGRGPQMCLQLGMTTQNLCLGTGLATVVYYFQGWRIGTHVSVSRCHRNCMRARARDGGQGHKWGHQDGICWCQAASSPLSISSSCFHAFSTLPANFLPPLSSHTFHLLRAECAPSDAEPRDVGLGLGCLQLR